MKKFLKMLGVVIAVVVSVIVFGSIVSTSDNEDATKDSTKEVKKETSKPKEKTQFKLGEDVTVGNLVYNVSKLEKADSLEDSTGLITETPRDKYLVATITITNNKNKAVYVSTEDILIKNGDSIYKDSSDGLFVLNQKDGLENILLTELNPNQSVTSEILFDIPESVIDDSETSILIDGGGSKKAEISLK